MMNYKTFSCLVLAVTLPVIASDENEMDQLLKGRLELGHEARTFQPCLNDKVYWLNTSVELLNSTRNGYEALVGDQAYSPVYVELIGEISLEPADTGFAAGYDGTVDVVAMEKMEKWDQSLCNKRKNKNMLSQENRVQRTYVLECETGTRYVVGVERGVAWVFSRAGTRKLTQEQSDDKEIYSNNTITVVLGDSQYGVTDSLNNEDSNDGSGQRESCANNRKAAVWEHARLNGASFRATGNEPGWNLEIHTGLKIVLVTNYGEDEIEVEYVDPEVDQVNRISVWRSGGVEIRVSGEQCIDSMSGDEFATRVTVKWGSRLLRGCGRALH